MKYAKELFGGVQNRFGMHIAIITKNQADKIQTEHQFSQLSIQFRTK